jgi:hypothetical protein
MVRKAVSHISLSKYVKLQLVLLSLDKSPNSLHLPKSTYEQERIERLSFRFFF